MDTVILQFFEGIRSPALDVFFGCFSLLGEATVVGGCAILLFWLLPRKKGEAVIMTALSSFSLNALIKFTVARPRPYVAGVVEYRKPPFFADDLDPYASFPSGHTQSSSGLLFAATARIDSRRARLGGLCASLLIVLFIMTARIYFGAHYPTDVLTGLAFGICVTVLWILIFRFCYGVRNLVLLGLAFLSLIPLFFSPAHDYVQATGLLTGGAIALSLAEVLSAVPQDAPLPKRLLRVPVGGLVCGAVFALCLLFPEGEAFSLLKWSLLAFTAGFVSPFLFAKLKI